MEKNGRRITVAEMAPHIHSFLPNENKVDKLTKWLVNWISISLECGKIKPYDFLPSKADLACHIGVSQGTIQNAYRNLEDLNYIESKQRIGSFIKNPQKNEKIEKLTSKRELAIEIIKKFILENNFQKGEKLISTRNIAQILGLSNATARIAIANLVEEKILEQKGNHYFISKNDFQIQKIQLKTLVEKIASKLENYIENSLQDGTDFPTNKILAKKFQTSIKTINDAIKILVKKGLLKTRRGRYGTYLVKDYEESNQELYQYEKYIHKIKNYIIKNCEVGMKLPSIKSFSAEFKTSEKTIKKALNILAEDGYVTFVRGRYGGTFVTDIPQAIGEAYKWLAISSDFVQN